MPRSCVSNSFKKSRCASKKGNALVERNSCEERTNPCNSHHHHKSDHRDCNQNNDRIKKNVDVFIQKSCPTGPLTPGSNGSFTVTYGNNGNVTATDVDISDTLHIPAGVTVRIVNNGGTNGPANNTVITGPANAAFTLSNQTLAAGSTNSFTIIINIVSVTAGEHTITNKATISAHCDAKPCNNEACCSVVVQGTADLFVEKLCPAEPLTVGDIAEFTVDFGNNGSAASTNVTVTDTLTIPAGVVVRVLDNGGTTGTPNGTVLTGPTMATFQLNLASLGAGETGSFKITVRIESAPDEPANIMNTATITGSGDTSTSNNTDNCVVEVAAEEGCVVEPIPFCCYVTVPEGFSPVINPVTQRAVIAAAIINDCTHVCAGTETVSDVNLDTSCGTLTCDIDLSTSDLTGCVLVESALQIRDADGQTTYVCCCECVCIDDIRLCISCPGCDAAATNITIDIDPASLNAVFVDNSCESKSVYKIVGKLIVDFDCPTCE